MDEKRDRYGRGGNSSIAPGENGNGNRYGSGNFNGNGGRGYNGRAPPYLGLDGGESLSSGRGPNDERYGSRPPNTPMTPYTPFTPKTVGYDGGESSISAGTPRHDRYYGEESAIGGRPGVTPGTAPYRGGEGSFNVSTPRTARYDGGESYIEGRTPKTGRYDAAAESTMSAGTPRTGRFDPGMESSIANPDTPRTAHYDTTATTMSMDPSRTGPYDKDNTITVAEYYDPERAREHERQMMERERFERERGMPRPSGIEHSRPSTEYLSTSGSSTSSYLDISRHFPTTGFSIRSFFSTPSEKSDSKRKKKKKSKKLTRHNSSSSSSLNEDLAFGTGFLRYRRKRNVRSRDGRDRQWETVGYKSSKENLREGRSATSERPTSARRPTTEAKILAVGAGLAKLAREYNEKDIKNGKNGRAVPDTTISSNRRDKRSNPSSRIIPKETDPNDDEAWESASDDESDSSVDTGLAFGGGGHAGKKQAGRSKAGFFGRRRTHGPKSKKSCVVDPRLLGPQNSLNGYLSDRAVGFEDVQWESGSDFGQHTYTPYDHPDRHVTDVYVYERERVSRTQSAGSYSQAPLQQVFPVPTDDPSRFDVARASSSEQSTPRPAPVPIQQPQPFTPVSQSVYYESKYVRSESGGILKSSPSRSKSLAGAALAGVAGAAVGAVIASNRRDEKENARDDDRRDQRSYSESAVSRRDDNRKERRRDDDQYSIADSSISKPRDDDRKERRRDYDQTSDRDKNRERIRDDPDAAAEERERRRRERREERRAPDRIEDNYEERRTHVLSEISAIARTPTDPFQYQVADSPPHEESSSRPREESVPSVVTVEREPDFTVKRSSSIKESYSVSRSESRTEFSEKDDREQRHEDEVRVLRDAERIYEETEHSTAPIEAAAIAAAAAAIVKDGFRESRSAKRRGERRSDSEDPPKDSDSTNAPEKSHEDVMAEADRAYREIVMARKVAAEVRRSRTPSPERSVINKYEEEPEEEPPRIVTPPGMHERKKGPYDAPNADFKLDYIMTPKDLKVYSIPAKRYKVDEADLMGPFMTKDPDARLPRPLLNLIRPTPTSTPSPEKQFAATTRKETEKTTDSNQSTDHSTERSRPEPESEHYSKVSERDEEREQTSTRSQDEPTHFNDRNQDREQISSYRSQDEPTQTRDEDLSYEKTSLYQSQDEQMDGTQAHEQTSSYRSEDIPRDRGNRKRFTRDMPPPIVIGPRGDLIRSSDVSVPSPTQSTVSKAVTWGPNETKHFEVESPTELRDDFISDSSPETPENPRYSEPRSEPRSEPKGGWAAMAAGILGAGAGTVVAGSSESAKRSEVSELPRSAKSKDVEQDERPYEYRGVVVEPESPYGESRQDSPPRIIRRDSMPRDAVVELGREILARESRRNSPPQDIRTENLPQGTRRDSPPQEVVFELGRQILARESRRNSPPQDNRSEGLPQVARSDSAPSVGPKPSPLQSSHMPGSFEDDLEFIATVAAGLQDTGFNPDLATDETAYRKRVSPPGSNEDAYKSPWAESADDISTVPGEDSSNSGFVLGEVPETPKDWTSISPADDEQGRASRKEQKKRDRERRRSSGDVSSPITDTIVEEPESYFDSSRQSRKEQKKRDKEEARRQSLLREESSFVDISPAGELVEEPESYIEPVDTPKKPRKLSRSSTYDDYNIDSSISTVKRKSSKRSSTYDDKADSPLRESRRAYSLDDIKNGDESKISRKAKRDSGRFDSPSNSSPPSEAGSDRETSSRKKSKERSLSRGERHDSPDPSQIPLPAPDNSREDLDLSREPERSSRRDGDDPLWASSRSILSAGSSSKQDDEDPSKRTRKDRNSTQEENDGTRSIAVEPTRDENEEPKKKAKETPKKSAKDEPAKGTRDEIDEVKKKKKKRSSTSDGITGSQPSSHLSQLGSSETNGHKSRNEDGTRDSRNDVEGKRSKNSDSKKDSFLDNAGILGAGAGLAAGAIAISAQHQQQNAANNNDSEGTMGDREGQENEEILDPEIIERQINPSIDPQYGDLLPLPPSGPVSPNFDPIDDLPKLPESRPATPESKKTYCRRGSFVPEELIDPLPHLPPSRTNSELDVADLSELGILEKLDLHRPSLDPLLPSLPSDDLASGESTPTAITFKRNLAPSVEFLQDSFPSLEEKENLNLSADVHSHEPSSSDSLAEAIGVAATATANATATATDDTVNEKESRSIQEIQDKTAVHNLEYTPVSHDIAAEQEKTSHTLTGTSNEQTMSIEEELETTEEFPLSKSKKTKRGEGLAVASNDITDQAENTPEQIQELEPISTPTKAEHVEPVDEVSTSKSKQKKKGHEDKQEPKSEDVSSEQQTVTGPRRNIFEELAKPIEFEPTQPDTPKFEDDKNDKSGKTDSPFVANLKAESVDDAEPFQSVDEYPLVDKSVEQEQVPESSQEIVEALLPSEKKKDEEKAKAAASQLQDLVLEPVSVLRRLRCPYKNDHSKNFNPEIKSVHNSPKLEISHDITPTVDEFTSPKSKTDIEEVKVETISLDSESKQAVIEPDFDEPVVSLPKEIMRDTSSEISHIPVQETSQEPTAPTNVEKSEEFSNTKSENDKKETKDQTMDLDQVPADVSQEQTMEMQEKEPTLEEKPKLADITEEKASKSNAKEYFPDTEDISPAVIVGAAVLGAEQLKSDETPQYKKELDDLAAGYGNDQPSLLKQLDGESAADNERSRKDKKYQSQSATSERSLSRSRSIERSNLAQPRSRSATMIPSATPEHEELKRVHSNETPEPASQLQQELTGSSSIESEQEKRSSGLSKFTTHEETPNESFGPQDVTDNVLSEGISRRDGGSAGHSEEQLSLAPQSTAEFGEESENDEKLQIASQTPQEEKGQPFDDAEKSPATEPQNDENSFPVKTEALDGLDAGDKEDQLEPAKQLKEEFTSSNSKDKKMEIPVSQNQNDEFSSNPITSDSVTTDLNDQADVPTSHPEIIEGPANQRATETPLEKTPEITQEPEIPQNVPINPIFTEPEVIEKEPVDQITTEPVLDSLLASDPSGDVVTSDILDKLKATDTPEPLELEYSQIINEPPAAIDPETELGPSDEKEDGAIEPTSIDDTSLPNGIDGVKSGQVNYEEGKHIDVQQEIPGTPPASSTVDRKIEFSSPPKKSQKDKGKPEEQAQDLIEDDVASKDITSASQPTNTGSLVEQADSAPVEQIITMPAANEPTLNDAPSTPMTAGLSGLMGPLTGRKKGVLEMVQALGWGKKKDKAAIAAAEQGLPPRPSTARPLSESSMTPARAVSESSVPKVIEADPNAAPASNEELEKWALPDKTPRKNSKGKNIANVDLEPVQDTIIEETLPIEPKEDIAQQVVEPPASIPIQEVQSDTSPKRQRAFRARESASKEPETPSLITEPAFIEHSSEVNSEPSLENPVEENKEHETESVVGTPIQKSKKDEEKRQSVQSATSEDTPMKEPNVPRENHVVEESKSQTSGNEKPVVESSNNPLEIPREHVLEDVQTPQASVGHNSESIDEVHGDSEEFHGETVKEEAFASKPQPEHISMSAPVVGPIIDESSEPEEVPREFIEEVIPAPQSQPEQIHESAVEKPSEYSNAPREIIEAPLEHSPEPIEERFNEPLELSPEVVQEDDVAPQAPLEHVPLSTTILNKASLPNEPVSEEITKTIEDVEPIMVDDISSQTQVSKKLSCQENTLSEKSDKNIEVAKPNNVDVIPLQDDTPEEDPSKVEFDEPRQSFEDSFLARELALEENSKDFDQSSPQEDIIQDESRNAEIFAPIHILEESSLSTEPATNTEKAELLSSEIPIIEESDARGASTTKKSKNSKDKSKPEPVTLTEIIQEPEPTHVTQESISEKPFEATESNDPEMLDEPIEKGTETVEPETYHFLDPASVPLPEDISNESIELDEPTNAEILEKPFEYDTSTRIPEVAIANPEIEKPEISEKLDDSEYAASIPLPEDDIKTSTEYRDPEIHGATKASGLVSGNMEQVTESPFDLEDSSNRESSDFSKLVSPIVEKSIEEPASLSPKSTLTKESPLSEPISKIDTRAAELISEEVPQIPAVPVAGPSEVTIANEPQPGKEASKSLELETEQKVIEPMELATAPRNIEAAGQVSQDNFAEPIGRVSPKQSDKDENRKSRTSISSAEENTTRAPLGLPAAQQTEDKPSQASIQNPTESVSEAVQPNKESIVDPTLITLEAMQDDAPESTSQDSLDKQSIEPSVKNITDSQEPDLADPPTKKSTQDEKERAIAITTPSDNIPTESRAEMSEPSQSIVLPPTEGIPGDILAEEFIREVTPEPKKEKDEITVSPEPTIEPMTSEPHQLISQEPVIEPDHAKEESFASRKSTMESQIPVEPATYPQNPALEPEIAREAFLPQDTKFESAINEERFVSREPIAEPDIIKEEDFVPQESTVKSKSQPQMSTPQNPFLESDITTEENFVPQESTFESQIPDKGATFQQEPDTTSNSSNSRNILAQDLTIEPTKDGEQLQIQNSTYEVDIPRPEEVALPDSPIIEASTPKPEQIALPDSPIIEAITFRPEQIALPDSPIIEARTFRPEQIALPDSPIIEASTPKPEQIALPDSPIIEAITFRPEQIALPDSPIIEARTFSSEQVALPELPTIKAITFGPEQIALPDSPIIEASTPSPEQVALPDSPIIEANIPSPEQVALPESPIKPKLFEPKVSFPHEFAIKPETIEEAPVFQDRKIDHQILDLKLAIPQKSPIEPRIVELEPEQISLPESPIEQEVSELEIPFQQEPVSESHIVEEPMFSRERRIETESSGIEPLVPIEVQFEHKVAEPGQIALPKSPIEQQESESEVSFQEEPVVESKKSIVDITLPGRELSRTAEPDQIALPDSPIEEIEFQPEVFFQHEPVVDIKQHQINSTLPGQEPSAPQDLPVEKNAAEIVLSPQAPHDLKMTEEAPIFHDQNTNSKSIEQKITHPREPNARDPILESKIKEDAAIPQEQSAEPNIFESEKTISDAAHEIKNDVELEKSRKDKEKRKTNLDLSETLNDPADVTSTSQGPDYQTPVIASWPRSFDPITELTPSSEPIGFVDFHPDVESITSDPVDSTHRTEPTTYENAIDVTLRTEPTQDQTPTESLPVKTEPAAQNELAWPAGESKEDERNGENVSTSITGSPRAVTQAEQFENPSLEITQPQSTEFDTQHPQNVTEEPDEEFFEAAESLPTEETMDPDFEKIPRGPTEQSIQDAFKPLLEEPSMSPIPETAQQITEDAVPDSQDVRRDEFKAIPVGELLTVDLPRESLIDEHSKEGYRPVEDDVTEVLTKNSKDIKDRESGFSSPVQFTPKDTQSGAPDIPCQLERRQKEVQQQTEDEWGSVSTEKSKKDKKRNSTLSTPLEPEVLSVATELPKDIPSNSGRAEELPPTIDNDVPDTHTSFQVQQVDTIVRGDDLSGMSHDKKEEQLSSGKFHSESHSPTEPNAIAASETQHIEPGEQLLTSPLPMRNIIQTSEPATKPEPILSTTSSSPSPVNNEADSVPSDLSLMGPKKDKRKRQATISLNTPKDDRSTFWAGEIPEAEIIRAVPVIEDIGRDEFYSHIARTAEEPRINEYSRPPAKKVKRNTRRQSSNIGNFRPPIESDLPHNEPMKERKEMMPSVIATTVAIASAAFLASKSKESEEPSKKNESPQKERPNNDKFDDSVRWADKDPKVFGETEDVLKGDRNDGHDRDGFQKENKIVQEPEQMENTQEWSKNEVPSKYEPPTPRSPALDHAQFVQEPEQMQNTLESTIEVPREPEITEAQETPTLAPFSRILDNAEFVQEPEEMETAQDEVIAETLSEPGPAERTITHESEQMEIPQEPMVQIPSKPLIMEAREIRTPTPHNFISDDDKHLEIERVPVAKHYASSSSPSPRGSPSAREPRGDPSEDYLSRPPRRELGKKKDEFDNIKDLLPAPIQEALRSTIVQPRARSISPSPASSPTAERAKRARSRSRPPSRPGTPGLTMLPEEPEEEHASIVDNRDSAFVNDSPIPPQGNLTENHEDIRDSGIHVRDHSPSMHVRAPVSSADAAIESMAWPSVDEDAGTVDLKKPQRPNVVESLERHDHGIDDLPSQKHRGEKHTDLHKTQTIHGVRSPREEKHKLTRKTSLTRGELAEANHVDFVRSQRLKAFQTKSKERLSESNKAEPINKSVTPEKQHTRHRVHRSELTDPQYRKPKENKYGELEPTKIPRTHKTEQRSVSESSPSLFGSAALAAAGLGFAAARKSSQESRPSSAQSHKRQRSASNISVTRLRTPVPLNAPQPPQFPESANTNRSFTPPLRRASRKISGDLKSLRQQSNIDLAKDIDPASAITAPSTSSINTANPTANEGRARAQEMADVYDGYGEGRIGSPRSPTRPHSMRRRQSMQVLELESKLDQLTAENRALAESKAHAEHMLRSSQGAPAALVERDAQIDLLKRTLASMQDEVKRLTEVNAGLSSAAVTLGQQHNARYGTLESQHAQTSRELQQAREAHHNLQMQVEGVIHNAIQERDNEISSLRTQLDAAKEQIRVMQKEILAAKAGDAQFLIMRDEDYFDTACQQLCQHVQQWVLRFSKFSDMRACRLTSEINNDKTIDRLDNAILDGSDVDSYLADRVRRRDVFMSMTMTMLWEFIFTRYLFGMDRDQRQKLKSLEKVLSEVGPQSAVHQWRATTLTLLSRRDSFARQKEQDTLAVVHAVFETLTEILPPPSHLEGQIEEQLKRVVKAAVDLSIQMRTQRAEYMMLPPLQPEYDANGDLASKVSFNAALMNERSGDTISNEELEAQKAVVRVVLFPLVVKKGDDFGQGDEEIVVCPAQVLVAKPRMGRGPVGRVYSPASGVDMDRRSDMSRTPTSMQSSMPDTNVI
ncbi:hypothetical protein EYC84_006918 [Monilinia fructicola]|uniref:Involucrin repeat protein n=1 Tax=Monilinia fructicola TaxID=38448 RepID=A0A5M9K7M5_MONFR|nr:hypothetical protein EYC84_006918 [Monilinia fructicola]